ncbi:MAG: protease modulator HflC [Spirochaetia bacterium]|nr:protease modulator HflC [Spirochaetia bacterium]
MKKLITALVIIVVLAVILFLLGPFYVLTEGEQAVVTRFGKVVSTNTSAGLQFKMPVIDNVVIYPKKILSWDGDSQRIPTKENQFIWVDTTARWKVSDPLRFYESVTSLSQGYARLDDVVDSAVRTIISENFLKEAVRSSNIINETKVVEQVQSEAVEDTDQLRSLTETQVTYDTISKGRRELSNEMFSYAAEFTAEYGIELIDVIIRQIRYSDDLTESVYQRMIKERNQIAEAYRSFGQGEKAKWVGRLDNEKKKILSGAYATSEEIRGKADGEATRIYAEAYEADIEFFEFWMSLDSYKKAIPNLPKTLSTEMEYFDYLYSPAIGE